jgi:hypothetical protein
MSGECEECSKKQRLGLQTKRKVNEPGDIYEREADRIANQMMATPAPPAVSGAPPRIQRFSGQSNGQMDAVPASVDHALAGPGRPLDPVLRQDMEQRFGYDFSRVRVHVGAAAEQSARAVNALAYTVGSHVVFGAGQYSPRTTEGQWLLAHELAHTAQQENSRALQPNGLVSDPTNAFEREADRLAEQVVLGSPTSPKAPESRLVAPGAMILRYRSRRGAHYYGRDDDSASGLVEQAFTDKVRQPWIEQIHIIFDGKAPDANADLASVPASDRLMATGHLQATYHAASRPAISTPVEGGSTVLGLTDKGNFIVQRIEGVGYNAGLKPGMPRYDWPLIPGTKYSKDPDPSTPIFTGRANMNWAVFFNDPQALHEGPSGVGAHGCVHVPRPFIKQINYHSVEELTKVSVSYSSASALTELCCARLRRTGIKRNPCGSVNCLP